MNFQWAEGFHAPKGVSPDAVKMALDDLLEPTPDHLLEATKRKRHCLHEELWSEGDQVWATRARRERCRHIIQGLHTVEVVGGKEITVRYVEFVKTNGDGRWANIETILADDDLTDAYLAEVQKLQQQAIDKLAIVRALMKSK